MDAAAGVELDDVDVDMVDVDMASIATLPTEGFCERVISARNPVLDR
jgi:hypothetical protein